MRSSVTKLALTLVPALLAFALAAPAALAQTGNILTQPAVTYQLTTGWFQGRQTFYYDFGSNSAINSDASKIIPAPIFAFATGMDANGNPQLVAGQHNVIDVLPGAPGYSDLWQVNLVMVPAGYAANTIKSVDDINTSGYQVVSTKMLVDCPVVSPNSKLAEPSPSSGTTDTTLGWYKGQEVQYFDFGAAPDFTAPIYAFATGMDANGNPQLVAGQHNIIDDLPGNPDYSPFWDVNLVIVPAGYQANSITSLAQIQELGLPGASPGQGRELPGGAHRPGGDRQPGPRHGGNLGSKRNTRVAAGDACHRRWLTGREPCSLDRTRRCCSYLRCGCPPLQP